MKISYKTLRALSLFYLFLPLLVFLGGWTRIAVSIPCILGATISLWFAVKDWDRHDELATLPLSGFDGRQRHMPVVAFLVLAVVAVAWCVLCGQGAFVCQKGDWIARNAIFRDMITHEWPVMYNQANGTLSYYIGHWLPAAAIGRAVFTHAGSLEAAWRWGNLCLLVWTAVGVLLTWSLLVVSGGTSSLRSMLLFVLAFVCFGGLDVIGYFARYLWKYFYYHDTLQVSLWHLDSWLVKGRHDSGFEFSSFTRLLSYVFNQTIAPWLATATVLSERNARSLGMMVFPVLLCGIFPAIGLGVILFIVVGWCMLCTGTKQEKRTLLADVFSPSNVLAFVFIALPSALYLSTNMSRGLISFFLRWNAGTVVAFLFFLLVEIGAFAVYLAKTDRRNPWVLAAFATIVLFQFIYVGWSRDFGMRAIIPSFFVVAACVMRLVALKQGSWRFMLVCLVVGAVGPIASMCHTICLSAEHWPEYAPSRTMWKVWPDFYLYRDGIKTYDCTLEELDARLPNGKRMKWNWRYLFGREPEKRFFYRYLAPQKDVRNGLPCGQSAGDSTLKEDR